MHIFVFSSWSNYYFKKEDNFSAVSHVQWGKETGLRNARMYCPGYKKYKNRNSDSIQFRPIWKKVLRERRKRKKEGKDIRVAIAEEDK